MDIVIVAHSGLTRAGARLHTALDKAHRCALLTPEQFAHTEPPPRSTGLIFVGDEPFAREIRAQPPVSYSAHGVSFGTHGNQAFIFAAPVADPMATLQALNQEVADLQEVAGVELLAVDSHNRAALRGIHLAGMYLDPYLPVPAETVVARQIDFSPARLCWERQYTFGIATFLAEEFDRFAASLR